jgi:hypothetical protein
VTCCSEQFEFFGLPHPAPSPAAVFGPGDKLVSDSHVMNKNHVVIGTGTALIDWV